MLSSRWTLLALASLVVACSSDDSGDPSGTAGTSDEPAGTAGTAGTAGSTSAGTGGTSAGNAGTAGTSAGNAGTSAGTAGTAGSAGESPGAGGTAGTGGSGGSEGGSAGAAGESGGAAGESGGAAGDTSTAGGAAGESGGSAGAAGTSEAGAGGEGGSTSTPPHKLTVTWSLKKADGTAEACPANYGTIKVSAQVMSGFETPYSKVGSPFEALFDCKAGTGSIVLPTSGDQAAPPCYGSNCGSPVSDNTGLYFVTLFLTESSGENALYSAPLVIHSNDSQPKLEADMTKGDRSLAFEFHPTSGFLLFNWGFQAKSNFASLSCAASGVDTVKVRTQLVFDGDGNPVANGPQYTEEYPCAGDPTIESTAPFTVGAGLSRALAPSYYKILSMEAFAAGQKVGQSDPTSTSEVQIEAGKNVNTSLPQSNQMVIENR